MKVERLQFSDQMVALDIDGDAGQAYGLYQAAFHRTPDKAGLGFWIEAMDQGHPLQEVANAFVTSQEFTNLYGANTTNAQFVTALYQNVLHRTPDQAGYDFWLQGLQTASRAQVLIDFSESAENQAQVSSSIQNGIGYLPGATTAPGQTSTSVTTSSGDAGEVLQAPGGNAIVAGKGGL